MNNNNHGYIHDAWNQTEMADKYKQTIQVIGLANVLHVNIVLEFYNMHERIGTPNTKYWILWASKHDQFFFFFFFFYFVYSLFVLLHLACSFAGFVGVTFYVRFDILL